MGGIAERVISGLASRTKGLNGICGTGFDTSNDSLHAIATELNEVLDLTRTDASIAVTDAETTLYIDDAPSEIINGVSVMIDTSVIEAGDTFDFKVYYRIVTGGTLKSIPKVTKSGVQAGPIYIIELHPYRWGMEITAQRMAGANRTFPIEVMREA